MHGRKDPQLDQILFINDAQIILILIEVVARLSRLVWPGQTERSKGMFSQGLVYKNRLYLENSGPNWSKLGSFLDKHHILHVIDLMFG